MNADRAPGLGVRASPLCVRQLVRSNSVHDTHVQVLDHFLDHHGSDRDLAPHVVHVLAQTRMGLWLVNPVQLPCGRGRMRTARTTRTTRRQPRQNREQQSMPCEPASQPVANRVRGAARQGKVKEAQTAPGRGADGARSGCGTWRSAPGEVQGRVPTAQRRTPGYTQSNSTKGRSDAMLYSGFLGFVSISSSWSTISGDSSPRPTMKRTAIMHRIWCHRNACPTIVATHMWNRPSGGAPPAALGASDSMLVVWSQASKEPGEPPRTVPGSRTCPELHAPRSGARAQAGTQHQGLGCTGPAPVRHPQPHAYTRTLCLPPTSSVS